MKLSDVVETYINHKRSLGMRFRSDASTLRAFCRAIGNVEINAVQPELVLQFLNGNGPITSYWRQKFIIIRSFYRYAQGRGFATSSPLPNELRNYLRRYRHTFIR